MLPITSNVALMTRPAELAGRTDIVRDGAVFRNIATGQIEGHMVEMARVPSQALQYVGGLSSVLNLGVSLVSFAYMRTQFNALNRRLDQIEKKIDKLDQKLDVLIGMVHRVDRKVDGVARALASMTSKIDARHRDQVFAEIGAVLDTLVYADKKSPAEAKDMVASNITPARKAIGSLHRVHVTQRPRSWSQLRDRRHSILHWSGLLDRCR